MLDLELASEWLIFDRNRESVMRRILIVATILATMLVAPFANAASHQTSAGPVSVEPMVTGLENPWAIAFLDNGRLLITERDGRLLIADPATNAKTVVTGVPEVFASGQGGLLDVVLDPAFETNRVLYLSYAEPVGVFSARTAVMRAELNDASLERQKVIFRQSPDSRGGRHFGSRIVPDGKGRLFVTLGDRGDADLAQSTTAYNGKVVRINSDGSPIDNGSFADTPDIWSYGHRNPQGAALDETGQLWTVSHGARGGDEINRPQAGRNYGWPVVSYGTHYSGGKIGEGTAKSGTEQPIWYWDPSIAPSGMMIYSGQLWPDWAGDIFVGSLKLDFLSRLDRNGDTIASEERLFADKYFRIRDVREGPDGAIWFLAVGDGTLFRVTPSN